MGTYFCRDLVPPAIVITQQLWSMVKYKIHHKVTLKNSSNPIELIIDCPSSLANVLKDKIKKATKTEKIVAIEQTVYDMYYLIAPEIDELLPFDTITNYYNEYGKQINMRKDMIQYLQEIEDAEPDTNRYEKMIEFRKYCSVYNEQLKRPSIKNEIKKIRLRKKEKKPLPPKIRYKSKNIVPKSGVIIRDMLIGFDERSKTFKEMGRMKIVLNLMKYEIATDNIRGESSLLDTYYEFEENEIVTELAAHPCYDPDYQKKSYSTLINNNICLNDEIKKTNLLRRKLHGLRSDPAFLYFKNKK